MSKKSYLLLFVCAFLFSSCSSISNQYKKLVNVIKQENWIINSLKDTKKLSQIMTNEHDYKLHVKAYVFGYCVEPETETFSYAYIIEFKNSEEAKFVFDSAFYTRLPKHSYENSCKCDFGYSGSCFVSTNSAQLFKDAGIEFYCYL